MVERRMVTGLFNDRESAEYAYRSATERGYGRDDVNLVMSDEARHRHFHGDDDEETELGSKAAKGAGIGAAVGGTVGAVLATLVAVGSAVAIPGLGLVVAGPLVAALAGAGAGGAAGTVVGALIGAGIPEERVTHYEAGLKKGGIVMGVTPRNEEDAIEIENRWKERGEHVFR